MALSLIVRLRFISPLLVFSLEGHHISIEMELDIFNATPHSIAPLYIHTSATLEINY
jgi:hypothetical protein